ncbi:hypothetical protein [Moraxella equi]|uniref:Uncharacterized protein n=1 Tax=Moraxella equi TaxID=60442 RepID=A0A378QUN0_9GAMM|nr:hypothetical protein [Moraxella equi]OPH37833.1 hypothetical protein B5J93_07585 [Moraxella equi]STZ04142.1 Uncharacterised protein [Moraxella equi]
MGIIFFGLNGLQFLYTLSMVLMVIAFFTVPIFSPKILPYKLSTSFFITLFVAYCLQFFIWLQIYYFIENKSGNTYEAIEITVKFIPYTLGASFVAMSLYGLLIKFAIPTAITLASLLSIVSIWFFYLYDIGVFE